MIILGKRVPILLSFIPSHKYKLLSQILFLAQIIKICTMHLKYIILLKSKTLNSRYTDIVLYYVFIYRIS